MLHACQADRRRPGNPLTKNKSQAGWMGYTQISTFTPNGDP